MTRIAVLSDCDKLIVSALRSVGNVCYISSLGKVNPSVHDTVIVDWRELAKLPPTAAKQVNALVPCIAVINNDQCIPDDFNCAGVVDFVTVEDICSTAFHWRLKQRCQNFVLPPSLGDANSPDYAVFNFAVNHLSDWVIVKDLQHRFMLVSDNFTDQVNLSRSQIIGKNDLEIGTDKEAVYGNPSTGWLGFWAQDEAVTASGVASSEENQDWRVFSLSSRYKKTTRVPLRNAKGDVYALLVIVSDITDRVHADRNLQSRNLMLRRVTEEKLNSEQHRKAAEKAVRSKNKFLAAASHDLRQPLHALGLFLAVLERRDKDNSNLDVLQKIRQSSESLNELLNSLLDISRLDAGVVDVVLETFSIESLLVSIRDEFVQQGEAKALQVFVDLSDAVVHTDRVLLGRILRNLMQNAITYTDQGLVSLHCKKHGGSLTIDVRDTGPGIPESQYAAIFSEYSQINGKLGQAAKGLGLGLAIVRKMAKLLNVDVHLQSDLSKGSSFSVAVPLGIVDNLVDPETHIEDHCLSGKNILLIDDEPDIREGLSLLLNSFQCHTICAESADQAIDLLDINHVEPDVMIVDYQLLHGNTGDVAIDRIRQYCKREIAAIMVTGDTSNERLVEVSQAGFKLLHKPVNVSEMIAALSQIIEEQQLSRLKDNQSVIE